MPSGLKTIVESMKAAAKLLGHANTDIVKKAKESGCPAFRAGNRIDVSELDKWIKKNLKELEAKGEKLSLKDQKTNEEIRKLRIANDLKEGRVIPEEDFSGAVCEVLGVMLPFLRQKLIVEGPTYYTNDVAHNRIVGTRVHDEILQRCRETAIEVCNRRGLN